MVSVKKSPPKKKESSSEESSSDEEEVKPAAIKKGINIVAFSDFQNFHEKVAFLKNKHVFFHDHLYNLFQLHQLRKHLQRKKKPSSEESSSDEEEGKPETVKKGINIAAFTDV